MAIIKYVFFSLTKTDVISSILEYNHLLFTAAQKIKQLKTKENDSPDKNGCHHSANSLIFIFITFIISSVLTALVTCLIMSNRVYICKLFRLERTLSDFDDNNTTIASSNSNDKAYTGIFKYANEKHYGRNVPHNHYETSACLTSAHTHPFDAPLSEDIPSIHQDVYDKMNITENFLNENYQTKQYKI
jgi:hypothetical protein